MTEKSGAKKIKEIGSKLRRREGELSDYVFGKVQPQAVDLETAVLGALMLDKDALPIVMDILRPESFYTDAHQLIYRAILRLFEKSHPVDLLTVTEELKKSGDIETVGGAYYLVELTSRVGSSANIEYHARIVAQKHIQRELIKVSTQIIRDAYEDTTDVFTLLDDAEQGLFAVTQNNLSRQYESMGELASKTLKILEELKDKEDGLTGVPTGFTELDRLTSGWQQSDLIILAARPGMGKCLGKGTKVLMYDGSLKKVEDIEVGDLLMGDDSTPRRVLSLARGREKMYWVRQNKGIDYRVNESHILSLKRSRTEWSHTNGDVLNISVKEYLEKSPKFKSNYKGYKVAVEFEEKPLPLPPYFLGLWLGDGTTSKPEITNVDEEVVEYIEHYAAANDLVVKTYEHEDKTPRYNIVNPAGQGYHSSFGHSLKKILREVGVLDRKHIPQDFKVNSTRNRLELLAGLLDSDGHYLSDSNGYEITQTSRELINDIKFLCDSLGFRTSLKKKKTQIASIGYESHAYRIRIYGDIDSIPVKIRRKIAQPWKSPVNWQVTGIQVEYDRVDDYYGFELDGNRLFLLEDMTVTHNTSFVLALARNAALEFNKGVAIFSLEMASTQLVQRIISLEAEISGSKLRSGKLEEYEWQQLHTVIEKISEVPIFIDDTPGINIFELRAKCRRLKMQHDIQMVIIDYLQLMSGGGNNKNTNREQEISQISRALKGLAKELSVPVIALSQLSRAVEVRGGSKRPQLSDLRECLTGDTRIALRDGSLVPIEELLGSGAHVVSIDVEKQKLADRHAELVWETGKRRVYELTLASGRQIKATAKHRFLSAGGWKEVRSLTKGDRMAIARTLPEPESPLHLPDHRLILLAHLIGDGSYLKGQPLRYTTASAANSRIVTEAAITEFGVKVNRHESKGNWHQLVFSGNGNRWHPAGVNKWLRDLGVFDQRSHQKQLPQEIFRLGNRQVALFLQHLWATDGTLFVPKPGCRTAPKIAFSTNSRRLAEDVAHLLLRFGLVARIRKVQQGKHRPMYTTEISGSSDQLTFLKEIGAFGDKRKVAAEMEALLNEVVPNTNRDTLPKDVFKEVRARMKELKTSQRRMADMRSTAYGGSSHFSFAPSRNVLSEYAELLGDDELRKWADSDLYWDSIVSIVEIGEEIVYDMTVPVEHAFIANGIVSHNSGAIEQDADIVSFIYRPEYYQIMEDESGQSLKGIAEIIIAKHRNGALDTVKLRFTDQFAKFSDLGDPNFDDFPAADPFSTPIQSDVITRPSKMNDDEDIPF